MMIDIRRQILLLSVAAVAAMLLQPAHSFAAVSVASSRSASCSSTSSSELGMMKLPKNPFEHQKQKPTNRRKKKSKSSSALGTSMLVGGAAAPFGITTTAAAALAGGGSFDPSMEAQVLTDMSHVGLDLMAFWGVNSLLAVRVAAVVGRILAMAADYIPDHAMHGEEIVFQSSMLLMALISVGQAAALPVTSWWARTISTAAGHWTTANKKKDDVVSLKDGKAYSTLLAPVGITWSQFKALLSVGALDWQSLSPGDRLGDGEDNEKFMYWLYSGTVQLQQTNGVEEESTTALYTLSRKKHSKKNAAKYLWGEDHFLLNSSSSSRTRDSSGCDDGDGGRCPPPSVRVVAQEPCQVLRINTSKLETYMKHDPQLADALRSLMLQGLQAKWNALLGAQAAAAVVRDE